MKKIKLDHAISPLVASIILLVLTVTGAVIVYAVLDNALNTQTKTVQVQITSAFLTREGEGLAFVGASFRNIGTVAIMECNVTFYGDASTRVTLFVGQFDPGKTTSVTNYVSLPLTAGLAYAVSVTAIAPENQSFTVSVMIVCSEGGGVTANKATITFNLDGTDGTEYGSALLIDGVASQADAFVGGQMNFSWPLGTTHHYEWVENIRSSNPSQTFKWDSCQGFSESRKGTVFVTHSSSITAHYLAAVVYCTVTLDVSQMDYDANTQVLSAGGQNYLRADLPCDIELVKGAYLKFAYSEIVGTDTPEDKRYVFISAWANDQLVSDSFQVLTSTSLIGVYKNEWNVSFVQVGAAQVIGEVVNVNEQLVELNEGRHYDVWTDEQTPVNFTYNFIPDDNLSDRRFRLDTIDITTIDGTETYNYASAPNSILVGVGGLAPGHVTVSGNYWTQWPVSVVADVTDVADDAEIAAVHSDENSTVDTVHYSELPSYVRWVDNGDTIHVLSASIVDSLIDGKRFRQKAYDPDRTINSKFTLTCPYEAQWRVTFTQQGMDEETTGTILTVYSASGESTGTLPYYYWDDAGVSVTFSYSSAVSVITNGKRFGLTGANPSSISNLQGPVTVTGSYHTEWRLRFIESGLVNVTGWFGDISSMPVINVEGTDYLYADFSKLDPSQTYSKRYLDCWFDNDALIDYCWESSTQTGWSTTMEHGVVDSSGRGYSWDFTVIFYLEDAGNYHLESVTAPKNFEVTYSLKDYVDWVYFSGVSGMYMNVSYNSGYIKWIYANWTSSGWGRIIYYQVWGSDSWLVGDTGQFSTPKEYTWNLNSNTGKTRCPIIRFDVSCETYLRKITYCYIPIVADGYDTLPGAVTQLTTNAMQASHTNLTLIWFAIVIGSLFIKIVKRKFPP